jgi:signal transduction histidine kinase
VYRKITLWPIIGILSLASFALPTYSQPLDSSKIDSLKALIATATGRQKYQATFDIAYELFDVDNQEAVEYADEAHRLSFLISDSTEITKSGRILGQLLRRVGRLDESVEVFIKVLPIAERNKILDEQKRILNALAAAYNSQALYDKALSFNFKSLEIREREGNPKEIAIALFNIGVVYYKLGDFELSLDYYQRAKVIKEQVQDWTDYDMLLINIGLCYIKLGRFEDARRIVGEAFDICKGKCSDLVRLSGEYTKGYSFYELKEYEKAKGHLLASLDLARKLDDKRFQAENLLTLGTIALRQGDNDGALILLRETEELSQAAGYNQLLIHSYERLYQVHQARNDFEKTSEFQSKYIKLKDSIYGEELIRNLAEIQSKHAERENIKTIAEQDEILHLNQIVIDRQRQVYFFVALVAVLSVIIALVFLRYSRALSIAKMQLSVMNQTLERRVEDRTKALQNVNNELDNFIYKTSHDIRGPLASLKGIANVALLELTDPKAQDYLHKLDASADKLNTILTRLLIVNQINHAVLTAVKIDFPELLQEILTFERKKGVPSRLTISHEIEQGVSLSTDRHVLRIILENLIDNAIKYHNSSDRIEPFVKIKVGMNGEGVKIKVIDNGIGIKESDPQKLFQMFVRASERSESGGIGLYLTKLASERLFAKVDYSTTAEKFTQFTVTLPPDLGSKLVEKDREIA